MRRCDSTYALGGVYASGWFISTLVPNFLCGCGPRVCFQLLQHLLRMYPANPPSSRCKFKRISLCAQPAMAPRRIRTPPTPGPRLPPSTHSRPVPLLLSCCIWMRADRLLSWCRLLSRAETEIHFGTARGNAHQLCPAYWKHHPTRAVPYRHMVLMRLR